MNPHGEHIFGVYNRAPIEVERGEGVKLIDAQGRVYIDMVQGIATNALGHANPLLIKALTDQAAKLWHVSNIFRIPGQEALANALCADSFADRVFFTNSGTEAIECALKLARKYQSSKGAPERIDIITFEGAFHGRTYAAVTAGGNPTYIDGFGPKLPGYVYLPYGDHEALERAAAAPTACAILVEPVQGEGGCRAMPTECLNGLRRLCDQYGLLLIFDEVQCGMARTGKIWAHQYSDITPDVMATAKALGGGFPIGACLATEAASDCMTVGAHGSTFGGNPLAMAVGMVAYQALTNVEMLQHVNDVSGFFRQQLAGLADTYPDLIQDIRGKGLLIGLKLKINNREFMATARDQDLLIAGGSDNCVRLLPPLTVTLEEASDVIARLDRAFSKARETLAAAKTVSE